MGEVAPGRTPREQGRFIVVGAEVNRRGEEEKTSSQKERPWVEMHGDVKERRSNGGFASQE